MSTINTFYGIAICIYINNHNPPYIYTRYSGKAKLPLHYNVGLQITEMREAKNLRQTDFAKKTGINQGDISKIEDGLKNITLSTLERLADGLDCTIDIRFKKK